ncbi:MAG: DUF456 domain-containing protein [Candidatus Nanosalina sp.]
MNLWLILAFLLMVLAVIGSFTPALPGALLSGIGVLIYWWRTGYQDPSIWFVVLAVVLSIAGVLLDWFSGAITARIGGASDKTSFMAGIAGLLGFIFLGGPIGVLVAVAGTVFLREYFRTGDVSGAKKSAIYSAVGFLSSAFMQALITGVLLLGFVLAVLI